ncbi:MAG: hypothetical protein ICV76_00225 [Nitrospiraceae bacterium]|nr:hypothetical protein [Nitrospiraceae bacterium]
MSFPQFGILIYFWGLRLFLTLAKPCKWESQRTDQHPNYEKTPFCRHIRAPFLSRLIAPLLSRLIAPRDLTVIEKL